MHRYRLVDLRSGKNHRAPILEFRSTQCARLNNLFVGKPAGGEPLFVGVANKSFQCRMILPNSVGPWVGSHDGSCLLHGVMKPGDHVSEGPGVTKGLIGERLRAAEGLVKLLGEPGVFPVDTFLEHD